MDCLQYVGETSPLGKSEEVFGILEDKGHSWVKVPQSFWFCRPEGGGGDSSVHAVGKHSCAAPFVRVGMHAYTRPPFPLPGSKRVKAQ